MRARVPALAAGLALAAALTLGAALLTRGAGPAPAPGGAPAGPAERKAAPDSPSPSPPAARLVRDPFRYADEAPERVAAPRPPSRTAIVPPPAPGPAVRLVGFVRAAGRLRAALAIAGDVFVAGPGEEAEGYRVLALDEESGVTLRDAAGRELRLPPPP